MRWSLRFVLAGAVLLAAGLVLPSVVPPDEDYKYVVRAETSLPEGKDWTVVPYRNLSREERAVFDAARTGDGSVRREERVNGPHYTHHYDIAGSVAVAYDGRTYVVNGWIRRQNFGLRYWGRPLLLLLGGLAGGIGTLVAAVEFLRAR